MPPTGFDVKNPYNLRNELWAKKRDEVWQTNRIDGTESKYKLADEEGRLAIIEKIRQDIEKEIIKQREGQKAYNKLQVCGGVTKFNEIDPSSENFARLLNYYLTLEIGCDSKDDLETILEILTYYDCLSTQQDIDSENFKDVNGKLIGKTIRGLIDGLIKKHTIEFQKTDLGQKVLNLLKQIKHDLLKRGAKPKTQWTFPGSKLKLQNLTNSNSVDWEKWGTTINKPKSIKAAAKENTPTDSVCMSKIKEKEVDEEAVSKKVAQERKDEIDNILLYHKERFRARAEADAKAGALAAERAEQREWERQQRELLYPPSPLGPVTVYETNEERFERNGPVFTWLDKPPRDLRPYGGTRQKRRKSKRRNTRRRRHL